MATATKAPARRVIANAQPTTTKLKDSAAVVERTEGDKVSLKDAVTELSGEMVTVIVPKGFKLTRDSGEPAIYAAGVQEMPLEDASHWFARAQGVKVYDPK